jgi:hypothetical protein
MPLFNIFMTRERAERWAILVACLGYVPCIIPPYHPDNPVAENVYSVTVH